jgi:hypothetical protein
MNNAQKHLRNKIALKRVQLRNKEGEGTYSQQLEWRDESAEESDRVQVPRITRGFIGETPCQND